MRRYFSDEGIILKKTKLLNDNKIITIFSRNLGKIKIAAFGSRKITSRRLSHLETGNFIKFNFYKKTDRFSLGETELIYGYSKIRKVPQKVNIVFLLFFILNKILAENQEENEIFGKTMTLLKNLNNRDDFSLNDLKFYFNEVLNIMGFVTQEKIQSVEFDTINFIEGLIDRKLKVLNYLS